MPVLFLKNCEKQETEEKSNRSEPNASFVLNRWAADVNSVALFAKNR